MAHRLSRRLLIRRTAGLASLPALARLAPGCAPRPRQLQLDLASYPALQAAGGAVLGHAAGHAGPIIVARLRDGGIVAFDGTCTHLACTVHPAQPGVLHCPCHGSTFSISPDPGNPQGPDAAAVTASFAGTGDCRVS